MFYYFKFFNGIFWRSVVCECEPRKDEKEEENLIQCSKFFRNLSIDLCKVEARIGYVTTGPGFPLNGPNAVFSNHPHNWSTYIAFKDLIWNMNDMLKCAIDANQFIVSRHCCLAITLIMSVTYYQCGARI